MLGGPGQVSAQEAIASDTIVGRPLEAPVNTRPLAEKFWWDEAWFENGVLPVPVNHEVEEKAVSYTNPADGTEVPAILYRPKQAGRYPGVLFQHGRRGLDELVQRLPRRLAARGFVVLAPDVYSARFIDKLPIEHLVETEGDTNAGVDYLLAQKDVSTSKICLYSHTRGGYYTLQVAVKHERQGKEVACYVSFYPHWQDPNAAEPMQVYRYATELDRLTIPTMVVIGEYEQYQRRRSIETAVKSMKGAGKPVRLITYPGVGRGFDFRPEGVRTFADDLASQDSLMRATSFIQQHLKAWER
ncbi:MAG: dienelactone hydrolase family protein [Gammaproteobacteria bacterium]